MAVEGTLDLHRLSEVLQGIANEQRTGILTVQGTEDIVAVSFLAGRIVAADALNATTEEGLGAALVAEGRLSEDALRRLASRAEAEGLRLADLLVAEGHVDREGLLEGLRVQTARLLGSLLEWRRGEFKFYGGDEVSYEEGFRAIGVDELLLAAAEERAREEQRRVPELGSRLRRLEPARPIRVRPETGLEGPGPGPDSDSAVWVTPAEQRLLEAVAPTKTVEEVARIADVPPDRARHTLYRFLRDGLVATVAATDGRSASSRPAPPVARPAAGGSPPPARAPQPEPAAVPVEAALAPRAERTPAALWAPAGMAVVVALMALAAGVIAPVAFLLPFPWLEAERAALHDERDSALRLEIDQAAKTFFLLEGRFPDRLDELAALGLLDRRDLADSLHRRLGYEPRARRYVVHPVLPGAAADAGEAFHEGIAGNFLLDPDFLAAGRSPSSTEAPLVLLD